MKNQPLISFLIPSRQRFDDLKSCVECLLSQIGEENYNTVEFVIKFDEDDSESISRYSELPLEKVSFKLLVSNRLGGYKDLFRFYNDMAKISRGRFMMMWNDDAKFETNDWFVKFVQQVEQDGKVAYSYWFRGSPTTVFEQGSTEPVQKEWPCFIAHHRLLYSVIGYFSGIGGCDSFLYYVLGPLGLLKKIESITVDHEPWFQIDEDKRDAISQANSEEGQVIMTNFKEVQLCQQKIIKHVQQASGQKA